MKHLFYLLAIIGGIILSITNCTMDEVAECPDCPVITALTPDRGLPGDTITISGKNFGGIQHVTFDNMEVAPQPDATATSCRVVVPAVGFNGPVQVRVTRLFSTPSGNSAELQSVEARTFTYQQVPIFSSFSPAAGGKGTVVTINGQFFGASPRVFFANAEASEILEKSDTQIKVVTPAKAGDGPIRVTTSDGASISSISAFTYNYKFSVALFLGQPNQPGFVVDVPAAEARLENVTQSTSDNDGNLYLIDQYNSNYFDVIKIDKAPPYIVTRIAANILGTCTQIFSEADGFTYVVSEDFNNATGYVNRIFPGQPPVPLFSSNFLKNAFLDASGDLYYFWGSFNAGISGIYKEVTPNSIVKQLEVPAGTFFNLTKNINVDNDIIFFNNELYRYDITNKNISLLYDLPLFHIYAWTYSTATRKIYFGSDTDILVKDGDVFDNNVNAAIAPGLTGVFASHLSADPQGNLYIRKFGVSDAPCLYKATLE